MLDALLVVLDGALVDTHAAHARSWATVLDQRGTHVPARRLQREIGRSPRQVLLNTTATEEERRYGPRSTVRQAEIFRHLLASEGAPVREGARELLSSVQERDVKVGVVTGLGPETAAAVEDATGFPVDDLGDVFIANENGEGAGWLPPEVLHRAADALGVHPAQCAAVVDTPRLLYDPPQGYGSVVAAGLTACAVESDLFDGATLTAAGARETVATPSDLAGNLDRALHRLGPQAVDLTPERMEALMDEALAAARDGRDAGEIPIGSVVADGDGTILGRGCNRVRATGRHTHHAEMAAFDDAAGTDLADRDGVILVTTLEPCVMCFGAALQGRVETIVYAHEAPENGAAGRVGPNRAPGSVLPRMVSGVRRAESRALLADWHEAAGSGFTERLFADNTPQDTTD